MVTQQAADVCGTDDCMLHASELRARMNVGANPCHSLHAFVCGSKASPREQEQREIRIYNEVMAYDSQKYLTAGNCSHNTSSADLKALFAYRLCLERPRSGKSGPFVSFMKERRIPWPSDPPEDVALLDVVLDLVINWRVALLFDLRRSTRKFHTASFVFQEPGPLIDLRRRQVEQVYKSEMAADCLVRGIAEFLSGHNMSREEIDILRRDEITLTSKLTACTDDEGNDVIVTLQQIQDMNPNVTSPTWLTLLKRHMNDASLTAETTFFAYDERRLQIVAEALTSLPRARSLNVVGWMFAYTYVWTVDPGYDSLNHYDDPGLQMNRTLCFLGVHESFGLMQILHDFVKRFEHGDIQMTSEVLQKTTDTLVQLVRETDVITEPSKRTAVEKIKSLCQERCTVRVSNTRRLEWLYRSFPNRSSSYFESWLESRRALAAALKTGQSHPAMTARFKWRTQDIHYLFSTNFLQVRMFAFYPPSFYIHGSPAISYSGLGFQMARSIVKAIVGRGRNIDEKLSKRFWWSSLRTCRWDEANTDADERFIRELFALKLTVKALQSTSGDDKAFLPLRSLEELTGRQAFYVSFCSRFCHRVDGENWCNLAMHEDGYRHAFSCHSAWPRYLKAEPECLVV
ncbi:hypothetical protein V5799_001272 [Amblyomma americanum]|uniref:Uncharacterized protein n=1 Tax=Amblyomma americanum TaxID=6943 RepID=A0AAQ4D0N7_AMBAM